MSTVPISQTRCKQLTELLTTKFKNKFKINIHSESHLIALVQDEVQALLLSGQAYEKNLVKLEQKLSSCIAEARKAGNAPADPSVKVSSHADPSQKTNKSNASILNSIKQNSQASNRSVSQAKPSLYHSRAIVYHLDPQQKLIPTDEQWNTKV